MGFEDEERSGQPSEVDNHGERSLKLIPLQLHEKLPKNSVSAILWSFGIWSKLERWRSSLSGWLMNWLQIKKIVLLKCHLFLFYTTTTNHFLIGCDMQRKVDFMTTSDDQLSGWTEKKLQSTSQSQTCTKKKFMVTIWWSAACLIHYSFLNLADTITSEKYAQQIDGMREKLQRLQLAFVNRTGPVLLHNSTRPHVIHPTLQKLNKLDHKVLPHPPHSPALSPTNYHLFMFSTTFCRENASTTRKKKLLSKSSSNPKAQIFMLQEQTYFLLAKLCWL